MAEQTPRNLQLNSMRVHPSWVKEFGLSPPCYKSTDRTAVYEGTPAASLTLGPVRVISGSNQECNWLAC